AAPSRVFATDHLAAGHPPAEGFLDQAAGILAIPISRSPRDYILFFRGETIRTVTWAGDPNGKEAVMGTHGPRLSPRKSFAAWTETVRGRSNPWSEADCRAAEALRVSVLEVLLRFSEETDRQRLRASQRQELLIAELNHRVRNILGLMRALVAQSRPSATSVDDFAKIIGGRIQALSRAHDQITSDTFSATSLRQIIETEVLAYIGVKASRVTLVGPDIFVEAKAFSTLALVFHEMVTNSAKYGALSDRHGAVSVGWRVDDGGACRIAWAEAGGPGVVHPTRRGFGSTIIERSIPHDLGGTADIRYLPAGVEADFALPPGVFHLVPQENASMPLAPIPTHLPPSSRSPACFAGLHGLIVEDNMIIALDAEQLMIESGMVEVHMAASVSEARKIIAAERVDVALLDVNLGSETSFALIAPLNEKGVPFVFVTGYGEGVVLPEEAGNAVALKKPFASDRLIEALGAALARGRPAIV
ncbi:MAG: response regulator, partial [Rhizobiaceae bacterium]|nr:response regulator [Rhizobiaceae bacterium]